MTTLITRLDAVERQLAEMTRSSEENGNRIAVMEADLARLRADQERRLRALETAPAAAVVARRRRRRAGRGRRSPRAQADRRGLASPIPRAIPCSSTDAVAEAAYDKGFQQWTARAI